MNVVSKQLYKNRIEMTKRFKPTYIFIPLSQRQQCRGKPPRDDKADHSN